jgi:hypothetical protein
LLPVPLLVLLDLWQGKNFFVCRVDVVLIEPADILHLSDPYLFVHRNPFDVLKILSQTNQGKSIPLASLVGQMYKDQGIRGFYRGVEVNIMRACVLNATKMGVYDISKGKVVESTGWSRKDPRTAFFSSFVAGFFMTCTVVSIGIFFTFAGDAGLISSPFPRL